MSAKTVSRSRGPNFTKEEQLVLFNSLQPFINIIECKKTDSVKQYDKQNAWAKIMESYNANTKGPPRSMENLISCYRNVKSKLKKEHSNTKMLLKDSNLELVNAVEENDQDWDAISSAMNQPIVVCKENFEDLKKQIKMEDIKHKKVIMGTGGGPPPPSDDRVHLDKIRKFIDPQMDGLFTMYDGDANIMAQFQTSLPQEQQQLPIEHNFISTAVDTSVKDQMECIASGSNISHKTTVQELSDNDPQIQTTPKFKDLTRTQIIRKRKASELMDNDIKKKKNSVNESFEELSKQKIKLVQEQIRLCKIEIEHKNKINELELEEKLLEKKFRAEMRAKELILIDLKIKKESSL